MSIQFFLKIPNTGRTVYKTWMNPRNLYFIFDSFFFVCAIKWSDLLCAYVYISNQVSLTRRIFDFLDSFVQSAVVYDLFLSLLCYCVFGQCMVQDHGSFDSIHCILICDDSSKRYSFNLVVFSDSLRLRELFSFTSQLVNSILWQWLRANGWSSSQCGLNF